MIRKFAIALGITTCLESASLECASLNTAIIDQNKLQKHMVIKKRSPKRVDPLFTAKKVLPFRQPSVLRRQGMAALTQQRLDQSVLRHQRVAAFTQKRLEQSILRRQALVVQTQQRLTALSHKKLGKSVPRRQRFEEFTQQRLTKALLHHKKLIELTQQNLEKAISHSKFLTTLKESLSKKALGHPLLAKLRRLPLFAMQINAFLPLFKLASAPLIKRTDTAEPAALRQAVTVRAPEESPRVSQERDRPQIASQERISLETPSSTEVLVTAPLAAGPLVAALNAVPVESILEARRAPTIATPAAGKTTETPVRTALDPSTPSGIPMTGEKINSPINPRPLGLAPEPPTPPLSRMDVDPPLGSPRPLAATPLTPTPSRMDVDSPLGSPRPLAATPLTPTPSRMAVDSPLVRPLPIVETPPTPTSSRMDVDSPLVRPLPIVEAPPTPMPSRMDPPHPTGLAPVIRKSDSSDDESLASFYDQLEQGQFIARGKDGKLAIFDTPQRQKRMTTQQVLHTRWLNTQIHAAQTQADTQKAAAERIIEGANHKLAIARRNLPEEDFGPDFHLLPGQYSMKVDGEWKIVTSSPEAPPALDKGKGMFTLDPTLTPAQQREAALKHLTRFSGIVFPSLSQAALPAPAPRGDNEINSSAPPPTTVAPAEDPDFVQVDPADVPSRSVGSPKIVRWLL